MTEETVSFDILLRSPASGEEPDITTLDRFRPIPEDVSRCRRWLEANKVIAHSTEFGLSCSTSRKQFEYLFRVALEPASDGPGKPRFEMSARPEPPQEIAAIVDQITLSATPEFF